MHTDNKRVKPRIGIFGKRNAGKSSIFNKLARFSAAIVSPEAGTTTDPVKKSIEHHSLGPLVLIDTPGLDDTGPLGELRIEKTNQQLEHVDFALLVCTADDWNEFEDSFMEKLAFRKIPGTIVVNKIDAIPPGEDFLKSLRTRFGNVLPYSSIAEDTTDALWNFLGKSIPSYWMKSEILVEDLCRNNDMVMLIVSDVSDRPAGRLGIPHNRIIRGVLDADAECIVTDEEQLDIIRKKLRKDPVLYITDSSSLDRMVTRVHNGIITGSSVLFTRFSGELEMYVENASLFPNLDRNARIAVFDLSGGKKFSPLIDQIRTLIESPDKSYRFDLFREKDLQGDFSEYSFLIFIGEENLYERKKIDLLQSLKKYNIPCSSPEVLLGVHNPAYHKILEPFTGSRNIAN